MGSRRKGGAEKFLGEKGGEERGWTKEEVGGDWREARGLQKLQVTWDLIGGNRVVNEW